MRFFLFAVLTTSGIFSGPLEDHWNQVRKRMDALERKYESAEPNEKQHQAEVDSIFRGMEEALRRASPVQSSSPREIMAGVSICGVFWESGRWNPSVLRFLREVSAEVVELDTPLIELGEVFDSNGNYQRSERFTRWAKAKGTWDPNGWSLRIGSSKQGLLYLAAARDREAAPIFVRGLSSAQPDIIVQSIRGLAKLSDLSHLGEIQAAAARAAAYDAEFRGQVQAAACEGPEAMCSAVKGK